MLLGLYVCWCICYADDIVLLAPCLSALSTMLSICSSYAISHRLEFNASKTQLICFHTLPFHPYAALILLNDVKLEYSDKITHLGHTCTLTYNLNDTEDIMRAIKEIGKQIYYFSFSRSIC